MCQSGLRRARRHEQLLARAKRAASLRPKEVGQTGTLDLLIYTDARERFTLLPAEDKARYRAAAQARLRLVDCAAEEGLAALLLHGQRIGLRAPPAQRPDAEAPPAKRLRPSPPEWATCSIFFVPPTDQCWDPPPCFVGHAAYKRLALACLLHPRLGARLGGHAQAHPQLPGHRGRFRQRRRRRLLRRG